MLILALLFACRTEAKDVVVDTGGVVDTNGQAEDTAPIDLDLDGDGFAEDDCDDRDPAVHPGATELCNGIDDDCDGVVDPDTSADAGTWAWDVDGDGYGGATTVTACDQPEGTSDSRDDCNDGDASAHPEAPEVCNSADDDCDGLVDEAATDAGIWYLDADGDGYGSTDEVASCDGDSGTVDNAEDCDDASSDIHPDADERCNGLDDDCDGVTDPDTSVDAADWYLDHDGDGFGDPDVVTASCQQPDGYVADDSDCDDLSVLAFAGASESCDGVDNDCNGVIDDDASDAGTWYADSDGDGWGNPDAAAIACEAPANHVADASDCDDGDAAVSPSASELCDGQDNDCDGSVDVDAADAATWYGDGDGDGFGDASSSATGCDAPTGYVADDTDCDDADADVHPDATELCDAVDDDCDGDVDEHASDASTWTIDYDGDGFGSAAYSVAACDQPEGYVTGDDDCDDTDEAVSPDGEELCDDVDNDCDGDVDEDAASDAITWYGDSDGDGYGTVDDTWDACEAPSGYVADATDCDDDDASFSPDAVELCNGLDDDCDGTADDGASGGDVTCAVASCQAILDDGSSTGDGLYWIDPDDDGDTSDAWEAWCDMSSDDGGWTRLYASLYPTFWSEDDFESVGEATDDDFSMLSDIGDFEDADGVWTLRLDVGNSGTWDPSSRAHYTVWEQAHDPIWDSTDGTDYVWLAGEESTTCGGFNGLHDQYYQDHGTYCMSSDVDANDSYGCWWMQIVPLTQYVSEASYPGYLEGYDGPNVHTWHVLWVR